MKEKDIRQIQSNNKSMQSYNSTNYREYYQRGEVLECRSIGNAQLSKEI